MASAAPPVLLPQTITAPSYPFTSSNAIPLEDMSSGTTQLVAAGQDDTASAVTNIGFDFWFDGVRQTQFSANANGLMGLGGTAVNNGTSGRSNDFATAANNPKMSAYWDDLCTSATGKVHFKVIGSAPNRKLVVEWLNMVQFDNGTVTCGTSIRGTYQVWLFETSGLIELVNGGTATNDNGNGGYSAGIGSLLTSFASVTTTGPTVSYAASSNANVAAIVAGTAYLFTPQTPTAPTGLNFTGTTPLGTTLNWTDTSGNEVGFVIYRSTDNVNFTFITQTAANATSFSDTGLSPTTQYFYQVRAVTEGALSASAANNVITTAPGNISSTAAGGNWSAPATWVGGVLPANTDNVTIVDGATVTIDTAAVGFSVTVGTGGAPAVLQWEPTTARTLVVGTAMTIASNGTFQSATTGTQTGHNVSIGGNLTNNGILDFSTNADTAGAIITFTGATNTTFSGTGATTDIRQITMNKGTTFDPIVDVTTSNFTVRGVTTDTVVGGWLVMTNGTIKVSGTFTGTSRVFAAAAYTIPATAGFWLNNPNYTVAGQAGSPTQNGLLRISQGIFNIGSASGNAMGAGTGAVFTIEGGTVNISGRLITANAVTYTQSGGTVNVCTVGNGTSLGQSFGLTSATTSFNMSAGVINLIQINSTATAANRRDYSVLGVANITGGTLNVGTAATTGNAGNFDFRIQGQVPALVVNNTTNVKNVILVGQMNTLGNVTIPVGSSLNTGALVWLVIGDTITNNGTITVPTNLSRFYFLGNNAQTYTGSGTTTIVTASGSVDVTIDNPLGLTIDPASNGIITQRINFFRGNLTNANKLTLGNGGTTVGVVQYGLTGTVVNAGTFDVAPIFNLGTSGETVLYAPEPSARTTGFEIPASRTLTNLTLSNPNGIVIAGGDLTLTPASAASTLTFMAGSGNIVTNANTLILNSATTVARTIGHVIGNFRKTYTAASSKLFEVGTANGFTPVTVNATAGTFPADFTVKATQGPNPSVNPASSVQRYWSLTGAGITADLTFQYLAGDVMGTEANYKVIREIGGISVAFPTSSVNTVAHTGTLTGVSSFSNWTVGEITSPTAAPATVSGIVTRSDGTPLGGVTVYLSGSRSDRTISDGTGQYRFNNVDTDRFYTVAPALSNYSFSPASRSFSLLGNKTDAVFTATANSSQTANPLNGPDFFVRQQYLDFLGREPDVAGWLYWSDQIGSCGADQYCVNQKRLGVSAAFFMSEEFQQSGNYIYRLYRGGLGREITRNEFTDDHKKVVGGTDLETQRTIFAGEFVARPEFISKYQNAVLAETFVDALLQTMLTDSQVDLSGQRDVMIVAYNNGADRNESRTAALRAAIEMSEYKTAVYNPSFVQMEYFGYLRRDIDREGFNFWVNVLNNRDLGNYRGMVCAFMTSEEYQLRFSPVVTRGDADCR
jgi:hypothetical protein